MKKLLIPLSVFALVITIGFVALDSFVEKQGLSSVSSEGVTENDEPEQSGNVIAVITDDSFDEAIEPSKALVEMTQDQKEKYNNLPDQDRKEMVDVIVASDAANDAVSVGAKKYFDLLEDEKRLEKMDADMSKTIALLNQKLGAREQK